LQKALKDLPLTVISFIFSQGTLTEREGLIPMTSS
jgi:hypothetical protein